MPEQEVWELDLTASSSSIGEKIQSLTLLNPHQVFRMMRDGENLIIVAIEGDTWTKADG